MAKPKRRLLDFDNRLRASYSLTTTTTGRLASRMNIFKTGTNLQNLPPEFRECIIPRPGFCFTEADKKQSEALIVAFMSDEESMKHEFFRPGGDIHTKNASIVFGKEWEEIVADKVNKDRSMRYVAKRMVHGWNYRLGIRTTADILAVDFPDLTFTEVQLKEMRGKYFERYPNILRWHREVEEQLKTVSVLINPFGRRRHFMGRMDEDLFRKGIAFLPQSTCVDDLNLGAVRVERRLPEEAFILGQFHDAILVEHLPQDQEEVVLVLKKELQEPFLINGNVVTIPIELKFGDVGTSWGELEELK